MLLRHNGDRATAVAHLDRRLDLASVRGVDPVRLPTCPITK